jgi:DNA topoisomerase-1
MLLRDGKRGPWLGCANFPKCRGMKNLSKLEPDQRKQVDALVPLLKEGAARSQEMIAKITGENPVASSNGNGHHNIATDIDCDECGKPMVIRSGRRGKFLGCSGYPKCKNTSEVPARLVEEMGLNGNGAANGKAEKQSHEESHRHEPDEIETDLQVD